GPDLHPVGAGAAGLRVVGGRGHRLRGGAGLALPRGPDRVVGEPAGSLGGAGGGGAGRRLELPGPRALPRRDGLERLRSGAPLQPPGPAGRRAVVAAVRPRGPRRGRVRGARVGTAAPAESEALGRRLTWRDAVSSVLGLGLGGVLIVYG